MNRDQRSNKIKELKAKGFKRISTFSYLYINENGKIYSLQKTKELKPSSRNLIYINKQFLHIAKLMLSTFKNEPIRENSQITYIDGNKNNLDINNIKYTRKHKGNLNEKLNHENLYIAIRCYFNVLPKYNVKDQALTRMYLTEILQNRFFYIENMQNKDIEIFKSYMQGFTNNYRSVAKLHNINIADCQYIINSFFNQLSNNILSELKTGLLNIKDYKQPPKTKTQQLKEINEYLLSKGLTPIKQRKRNIYNGCKKDTT